MIVPMLKYSFLVYHREYLTFLEHLQQLGVVHMIEKNKEISDSIREKYELIKQITYVIRFLQNREVEKKEPAEKIDKEKRFLEIKKLISEYDHKIQQLNLLNKEISQVQSWGDFSIETINKLKTEGLFTRFFTVSQRKFLPEWEETYAISQIGIQAGLIYFVLFQREGEEIELDAEEIRMPERSVSELLFLKEKLDEDLKGINELFNSYSADSVDILTDYRLSIIEATEYSKVVENTVIEAEDKLMLLEGWVPQTKENDLLNYLNNSPTLFIKEEIQPEDKVPILLKNKSFAEKFEVIGELYSLPSYKELDLTPFFAPFYLLFFGFCLGDAGYGILLAIVSIFAMAKVKKEFKKIVGLVLYLSLSTILFGLIGGTFFGIPLYETNLPIYSNLSKMLSDNGTDINNVLFYLSLAMGGIQIIFGLIIKSFNEGKQFGWHTAVGTLGWITLLIGMIGLFIYSFLTDTPMESLKIAQYIILGISGVMILLLNNLKRNILNNFGSGLWNTYNMVTGLLGDLLSYIRLFALGIASGILGFVFNSLAISMKGDVPGLNIIIMIIILLIGHSINLFMSSLGSFVHPMRLTFVEFYKNSGFTGGGKKYNPFKKLS